MSAFAILNLILDLHCRVVSHANQVIIILYLSWFNFNPISHSTDTWPELWDLTSIVMFDGAAALVDPNCHLEAPGPLLTSQLSDAGASALSLTCTLSEAEAAVVAKALRTAERAEVRASGQSAGQQPTSQPGGPVVKRVGPALKRPAAHLAGCPAARSASSTSGTGGSKQVPAIKHEAAVTRAHAANEPVVRKRPAARS